MMLRNVQYQQVFWTCETNTAIGRGDRLNPVNIHEESTSLNIDRNANNMGRRSSKLHLQIKRGSAQIWGYIQN